METDRFDALTARLAQGLTRRRGLGLLAALGAASALASGTEARKRKKGKKKHGKKKPKPDPQPCGGACSACQACFNGACVQVADGAACGSNGACFAGKCVTCPVGKTAVDGLCARQCQTAAECVDGGNCLKLSPDADKSGDVERRFCVEQIGSGLTMPACETGHTGQCPAGTLCVVVFDNRCATPL